MKKDNIPSAATARAGGMKPLYEYTDDEGEVSAVYGICRAEWQRRKEEIFF